MPFDYDDEDDNPADDLQAEFGLDDDLKDVEDYVGEYDE